MKCKIESLLLQEALKVALRLAPPMTESVNISVDSNKMYLISASELAKCTILIPGEVEGSAAFGVSVQALSDATKGRSEVELSYDKSMLVVKSGRYQAKLATVDAIQSEEAAKEAGDEQKWKLTAEQASWLKQAVTQVALKPSSVTTTFMPISVSLTDKVAFVSCYDMNHMAFIKSKDVTGDLSLTLPVETINAVLDVFNKTSFSLTVGQATMRIKNKLVDAVVSLPDTDSEEVISVKDVMAKSKEAMTTDGLFIDVARADVQQFLDNARAVIAKERSELSIVGEQGKITLSVNTTNGQVKSTVKADVKKPFKFNIDAEYFAEAVSKCQVELLKLKLVDGAFLMIASKDSSFVIALNQEEA
jgi:DNA polymerase III sliding clamp (beta) subunit (PCNA family)